MTDAERAVIEAARVSRRELWGGIRPGTIGWGATHPAIRNEIEAVDALAASERTYVADGPIVRRLRPGVTVAVAASYDGDEFARQIADALEAQRVKA